MYNNLCEMFMPEAIDEQAAAMGIFSLFLIFF